MSFQLYRKHAPTLAYAGSISTSTSVPTQAAIRITNPNAGYGFLLPNGRYRLSLGVGNREYPTTALTAQLSAVGVMTSAASTLPADPVLPLVPATNGAIIREVAYVKFAGTAATVTTLGYDVTDVLADSGVWCGPLGADSEVFRDFSVLDPSGSANVQFYIAYAITTTGGTYHPHLVLTVEPL